jgi:hypothetical protein
MGNQQSSISKYGGGEEGEDNSTKNSKQIPLEETIDYIATHYILTSDFQSLRKLNEKTYCEKMIVLTSDIINKNFSDLEVDKLLDRIENGTTSSKDIEKENIVFFNKSQLHNAIEESNDTKEIKCNQIAKFYIKIAHIFAAIVMTINPEYTHTDFFGNVTTYKLFEKDKIPNSGHFEVSKINLCGERIDILSNELVNDKDNEGEEVTDESDDSKNINVNTAPKKLCSMNLNQKGKRKTKTLDEEIGIPELMELYYDDGYDYKSGKFNKMSEETEKQFKNDLKNFYINFTGDYNVPESVTKFSDVKLRDYSKEQFCAMSNDSESSSTENEKYIKISNKNNLYVKYAENLRKMIDSVNNKQLQLTSIIDKVFVYVYDSNESSDSNSVSSENEIIRVNPELTEKSLQDLVVECRNYIKDLYLTCEKDFTEGIKIYEAIVESKIFDTTVKQIEKLEKVSDNLVYNEDVNNSVEKTM